MYATNAPSKGSYKRIRNEHVSRGEEDQKLSVLVRKGDLEGAFQAYRSVQSKRIIGSGLATGLGALLSKTATDPKGLDSESRTRLEEFVELLVQDMKRGMLPANPVVSNHILVCLRTLDQTKALSFWKWLEAQDESWISPTVYGSALELLAMQGTSLPEIEETYQTALSRYPGNFTAYHFSPNAVLPDRTQTVPPHQLRLPLPLLRGIINARSLRGDARAAYMGLDTILRLVPDEPDGNTIKHVLVERPLPEAYTAFAMHCRAGGVGLQTKDFRAFITRLRTSPSPNSLTEHICSIRAIISASYLYKGVNGRLTNNFLNEIIIAITCILRLPSIRQMERVDVRKVADGVLELVRRCLEVFARFGTKPGLSPFNAILTNVAGYGQSRNVIKTVLADITALGLKPNFVTLRSCLTAAGLLRDEALVRSTWSELVRARIDADENPDVTDMHVIIKAARLSDLTGFAESEYEAWKHCMSLVERGGIEAHLGREYTLAESQGATHADFENSDMGHGAEAVEDVGAAEAVLGELDKIAADFATFDEVTDSGMLVQDFQDKPLPMTLLAPPPPSMPEAELKKLYDEYTTEQPSTPSAATRGDAAQQAVPPQTTPKPESARTTTNIPVESLRYENWKDINFLLKQADDHDTKYNQALDRAIASDSAPPKRRLGFPQPQKSLQSFGLSDAVAIRGQQDPEMSKRDIESARQEIIRLRGTIGGA
ncbi:hypothetical protein MBLNU230_g8140t1 [Neophaeotheca triangularis]